MSYHALPDPRDLDEEGMSRVIQFCQANGVDPLKVPAPQGDPGFAFQVHGDTIRFREYVMDEHGNAVVDDDGQPRYTGWGELPLIKPAQDFGLTLRKVRA